MLVIIALKLKVLAVHTAKIALYYQVLLSQLTHLPINLHNEKNVIMNLLLLYTFPVISSLSIFHKLNPYFCQSIGNGLLYN